MPAKGLAAGGLPRRLDLPGVVLAGLAGLGFGLVLGPEGPLAIGSGLAVLAIRLARREIAPPVLGGDRSGWSFAALSFVFASPLIAAVILVEATAIGGPRLPLVLLPGLLAAGIGTLVSLGMGSFTGLSSRDYALGPLPLPHFGHPDIAQFGWTIALAIAVAVVARPIIVGGLATYRAVARRIVILSVDRRADHRGARDRLPRGPRTRASTRSCSPVPACLSSAGSASCPGRSGRSRW